MGTYSPRGYVVLAVMESINGKSNVQEAFKQLNCWGKAFYTHRRSLNEARRWMTKLKCMTTPDK